jgi:hypothetical protein
MEQWQARDFGSFVWGSDIRGCRSDGYSRLQTVLFFHVPSWIGLKVIRARVLQ